MTIATLLVIVYIICGVTFALNEVSNGKNYYVRFVIGVLLWPLIWFAFYFTYKQH